MSAKTLLISAFACLVVAIAMYVILVKIPADFAKNVSLGIKETFNVTPEVSINETVVVEQSSPIAELATVARDLSVEYSWSHQWLGSTKTIELLGAFTAKAGFDLSEPFAIKLQRFPLKVTAAMPAPKLLSLQMNDYRVRQDESGWWNRISPQDRENAVKAIQALARTKVLQAGILDEARTTVEQRITDIAQKNGAAVVFTYPFQERQ